MFVATNGDVSFWYSDIGSIPERRPALGHNIDVDVCIVGGGFTGLWTAYYLKKADARLSVAVLEREFAGFGASGRNGGNMTGRFTWSRTKYLKRSTADRLAAMERSLRHSVSEIITVTREEGIDADIVHAGNLAIATNPAQLERIKATYEDALTNRGVQPDQIQLLSAKETDARVSVDGAIGAVHSTYSARVQPAKLVRGIAGAAERAGAVIYEGTAAVEIRDRQVRTSGGPTVRANVIVRATEAYTAQLPGFETAMVPLNSAIIVTQPLPDEIWNRIGWERRETVTDPSHGHNYCQRTRGNRLTIGGRGDPYRYGSRTDVNGQIKQATIDALARDFRRMFPQAANAKIDHAWGGVFGVPRDWCASVGYDRNTGLAWGGGYVGAGIAASNLAGRTLRDLILGCATELTTYPWVNWNADAWEPEPLRWLAIHAMHRLYRLADKVERNSSTTQSRYAKFANWITGRSS
jgi:glycine/D-amino acid oxidase-like deaminating enzyme